MEKFKTIVIDLLKKEFPDKEIILNVPPKVAMGDLAFPCFSLAKDMKKSPIEIAKDLRDRFQDLTLFERIEAAGGYLNFYLNRDLVTKEVLTEVADKKNEYGSLLIGKDKKALIEHTSINPNASPHIGRARNALIGDTIVRLLKFQGYEVNTHYFVNDVGKQIAMLVLGATGKTNISFKDLLDIYININKRVKEEPELKQEVFNLLYEFENGNEKVRDRFKEIVKICIDGQSGILGKLGIKYDVFKFESDYVFSNRIEEILEKLKDSGRLFEDSEGRFVLNQEGYDLPIEEPYLVLTRNDKTSLYPLRDLAYTIDKMEENSEKNIIVLGEDQKLYFKQLVVALDMLGYKSPESIHYSFVLLAEGKMSTRNGTVVLLEDFMEEAVSKVTGYMKKNDKEGNEKIAQSIAYGAVKYAILKVVKEKNVTFDLDAALSFEGDTGPYLLYSYARINSIINKYDGEIPNTIDYSLLKEDIEYEIVKEIANFESVARRALEEFSPHLITNYTYTLTKKFSAFYHECSVLNAESEEIKNARIVLINSIREVIKNCLWLLGIETVEYM